MPSPVSISLIEACLERVLDQRRATFRMIVGAKSWLNQPSATGKREGKNRMAQKGEEEPMPTIEGKQAGIWINDYVKEAGKFEGVAKAVRVLVKNAVKGVEEYVNP